MPRTHRTTLAVALFCLGVTGTGQAAGLQAVPPVVRLEGPRASQRLLVGSLEGGTWAADLTAKAQFRSDDPSVAAVAPDGTVTPVADGAATVTVTSEGMTTTVAVSVEGTRRAEPWSFRNHVEPVLTRAGCNQGACHGAAAGKNGFRLSLRGYDPDTDFNVLTRQALGRRIVPAAPAESLLLLKPTGALEHGGGVRFATGSPEYQALAGWIAAGAPGPSADDQVVESLRVYPAAVRLHPGQSQAFLVQAVYGDGRVADVTRLAKFAGTDDTVARVDESGVAHVEGHGEASVTVWYSSRVARATVTSPYERAVEDGAFAAAPRRNPIDDRNLEKLRGLGLPPSPDAGDAAFLRRAYLDATGTLPPVDVVKAFLADPDAGKRAKLIDRLLNSPEYVDYWAYKWSDLLLVSSNQLAAPAVWSFYRFVRESVAANRPWDHFARAVITAKGSTLQNGAANFFALHRDPVDLTENASMAFLGMSLTCARCHNHPLEKWTQDQYYGMAALFARVKLKDGAAAGEVVVLPSPEGETRHPRTGALMAPTPLDASAGPVEGRADRRDALADWLASPENPYFDRAAVNRVWRNFFGKGLIEPEDDLRATNPASDEPLLDWLVADFRAHGRDLKRLCRTIMNSAAYARSSTPLPANAADTKFLSHYPVKRLPAEVILDAVSQVTGVPTPFAGYPAGWRSLQLPDSKVESPFLRSFGRPDRLNTCSCERSSEPSMTQALHLSNGGTINEKLRAEGGAVAAAAASKWTDAEILDRLFLAALSRPPTVAERDRLLKALAANAGETDPGAVAVARRQALEDLYWATLTGNEFLFNH